LSLFTCLFALFIRLLSILIEIISNCRHSQANLRINIRWFNIMLWIVNCITFLIITISWLRVFVVSPLTWIPFYCLYYSKDLLVYRKKLWRCFFNQWYGSMKVVVECLLCLILPNRWCFWQIILVPQLRSWKLSGIILIVFLIKRKWWFGSLIYWSIFHIFSRFPICWSIWLTSTLRFRWLIRFKINSSWIISTYWNLISYY